MKYTRPPYDPNGEFEEVAMMFSSATMKVPKMSYPISAKENFIRAAERKNPMWVPNSMTDLQNVGGNDLSNPPMEGAGPGSIWGSTERADFTDDFGCVWTFVPSAGGPMLKPGHPPKVSDITKWETQVDWPDLSHNDYLGGQKYFIENKYDKNKVSHLNIGQSCTERLVALLGGYTQAMVALAEEPEAVHDFLMAFADFTIDSYDKMTQLFVPDFVTYHDDWGTEKDTFFSPKMMEEIVFEPSKKIISHIKSKGSKFQLHTCGNIGRFVPYMIDLDIDFLQIQRRANDMPELKKKFGDRIGFNAFLEGVDLYGGQKVTTEELFDAIHATVDLYGEGGGLYTSVSVPDPKMMWDATNELYYYSREFYEK